MSDSPLPDDRLPDAPPPDDLHPDDEAVAAEHPRAATRPAHVRSRYARYVRRARRVAYGVAALVVLAVAAVGGLAWYLQSDAGQERARGVAVQQIANLLAEDATVRVQAVDGNFLTGARMRGLSVERQGQTVLTVDSLLARYTLRTLLRRTFSASDIGIYGPHLVVTQRADGTFDAADLMRERDEGGTLTVLIDRLRLERGRADVRWYNPDRDSVHTVAEAALDVRGFVFSPDSLGGTIDAARLVAIAPFDASRMRLRAAGQFTGHHVDLRDLAVQSTLGTDLRGRARLVFARQRADGTVAALPVFDADLSATPLALADARAFAGVAVQGSPTVRLRAESDGREVRAGLRASQDAAQLVLDAVYTRATRGPVRYRAEGTLRDVDPAAFTGNPALAGRLTGDLRAALEGDALQTLTGPFGVTLTESRLGQQRLDRVVLDGAFDAGRVRFNLDGAVPGLTVRAEGDARPFDRVPSVAIRGRAQDVNLALIAPAQGLSGRLSGDFAVEGRGQSAETFVGSAALGLGRSTVVANGQTYAFDRLDLDAGIARQRVEFDTDALFAAGGGRLQARGTADASREPLRLSVTRGVLTNVNPAALTGDPAQEGRLTGTFALDLAGTDPRTATADLTATLRESSFGTYRLARADATARLRRGQVAFTADADLGAAGGLTARGTAEPFRTPLVVRAEGTMRNLNVGALTGNPEQASNLSGTYTLSATGTAPATMTADARIALTPSTFAGRTVRSTDLTARLRAGALALTGTVDLPEGQIALDVTGRPFDARPSFAFGQQTCVRNFDVGALADNPDLRARVTGCFTGRLAGLDNLPTATADGVLTLAPSTVNDAEIERGRVAFTLDRGALAGTADLTLAQSADTAPADDGRAESLTDEDVRLAGGLDRLRAAARTGGRVVAAFQARPFDAEPSYAVSGRADALDVGALAGLDAATPVRLTTTFRLSGQGTDPETLTLDAVVAAGRSVAGPVRVDTLAARLGMRAGVLRVDTLVFASDVARLAGGGTVALFNGAAASDFRVAGDVLSLDAFRGLTDTTLAIDSGTFDLAVTGLPGAPLAVRGRIDAENLQFGTNAAENLGGRLDIAVDVAAFDSLGIGAISGRIDGAADRLSFGERRIERAELDAVLDGTGAVAFVARGTVDARRRLEVALRTRIDGTDPLEVTIERGQATIDRTEWVVARPSTITLDDGIRVDSLLLTSVATGQQISAHGRIGAGGEQDLQLRAASVDLGALADLAGFDQLGGRLSFSLDVAGASDNPLVTGRVFVDGLTARGDAVGTLDAALDYADARFAVSAVLAHVSGEQLSIRGTLPRTIDLTGGVPALGVAEGEVDLRAEARAFPIDWARPFLDSRTYSDLDGTLTLDLTIGGSESAPNLDGVARLSDGRLGVVATGVVYQPITADVTFAGNRIRLDELLIGRPAPNAGLDVRGAITLQRLSVGEFDLTITPRDFLAMDTRTFRGLRLGAGAQPLRLTGTIDRPVLRGGVAAERGLIAVTDELIAPDLEPVRLTAAQIQEVERRFGRAVTARDTTVNRFTKSLDYDLAVRIADRGVRIRADGGLPFDIEFAGTVQATKRPFAEAGDLFGQINLVGGSVRTLNRRFVVEPGSSLTFNGPALGAIVSLRARLNLRLGSSGSSQDAATILLAVSGPLNDNPEIRLSSDPPLDPADIVSLVATGRLSDEVVGAGAIGGAIEGLALGTAGRVLEGAASRLTGLNLAEVDVDSNGDIIVRVGAAFSSRTFWTAGATIPTRSTSSDETRLPLVLTLDYQLLRWLQAQGEFSGRRGLGGGLGAERSF